MISAKKKRKGKKWKITKQLLTWATGRVAINWNGENHGGQNLGGNWGV